MYIILNSKRLFIYPAMDTRSLSYAKKWAKYIVKIAQSSIGKYGINMYLNFLLEDGPDEMGIHSEEKICFQNNMCLYIACLLKNHEDILAKSQFASRFVDSNGVSIYDNAMHLKRLELLLATDEELTRAIISSSALILERGRSQHINDMFIISCIDNRNSWYLYDCKMFLNFQLKIALFNNLCELFSSRGNEIAEQRLRNLDAYFMSLAILGRGAEIIHNVDTSGNPVNVELKETDVKTCVPQSLIDPDFSFEKFISVGPISMFYKSPLMVNEMILVCRHIPLKKVNITSLTNMYGRKFTGNGGWYEYRDPHSAVSTLCRLHNVKPSAVRQTMFDNLQFKIGDKIEDPVQAFTRPF